MSLNVKLDRGVITIAENEGDDERFKTDQSGVGELADYVWAFNLLTDAQRAIERVI